MKLRKLINQDPKPKKVGMELELPAATVEYLRGIDLDKTLVVEQTTDFQDDLVTLGILSFYRGQSAEGNDPIELSVTEIGKILISQL